MTPIKQPPAVRFVVATGFHRVGDIIRPNGVHRDWLMSRGFVEYVPEPAKVEDAAPPEPPKPTPAPEAKPAIRVASPMPATPARRRAKV